MGKSLMTVSEARQVPSSHCSPQTAMLFLHPFPHCPATLHASVSPNPLTWSLFFSDSEDVSEFSSSVREGLP